MKIPGFSLQQKLLVDASLSNNFDRLNLADTCVFGTFCGLALLERKTPLATEIFVCQTCLIRALSWHIWDSDGRELHRC